MLKRTPLYDEHTALNAKMVPFAGFELPVQYTSIIAETKAVRQSAGMFDVSHMARLRFHGHDAGPWLNFMTTNSIAKLEDGRGQYSMLANEQGGVVDDIIVYRIAENEYRMVVNGANHEKDVAWLRQHLPAEIVMDDLTAQTAMIAVQGPKAVEILAKLEECPDDLVNAPLFGVVHGTIAGVPCFAARSGYTGEDGFEIICLAESMPHVWRALLQAGVVPCGLGSRDVLRVEAGLPLYGHELTDDRNPITAGLGWVVDDNGNFVGSEPILEAKKNGTSDRLVGILSSNKRFPEIGAEIRVNGTAVGSVSSGVYSPTLECGIAFAFVDKVVPLKTECEVDIRGTWVPATIVGKRFLKK